MRILNLLKRVVPQLIMISVVCLIAFIGYVNTDIIGVSAGADMIHTIIIDAGHGGLTNTIKA